MKWSSSTARMARCRARPVPGMEARCRRSWCAISARLWRPPSIRSRVSARRRGRGNCLPWSPYGGCERLATCGPAWRQPLRVDGGRLVQTLWRNRHGHASLPPGGRVRLQAFVQAMRACGEVGDDAGALAFRAAAPRSGVRVGYETGTRPAMTRAEYQQQYYAVNKERLLAYRRAWYRANRTHVLEQTRQYEKDHPLQVLEWGRKKSQRQRTLHPERFTKEARRSQRQGENLRHRGTIGSR